jgi:hypothetical protein
MSIFYALLIVAVSFRFVLSRREDEVLLRRKELAEVLAQRKSCAEVTSDVNDECSGEHAVMAN